MWCCGFGHVQCRVVTFSPNCQVGACVVQLCRVIQGNVCVWSHLESYNMHFGGTSQPQMCPRSLQSQPSHFPILCFTFLTLFPVFSCVSSWVHGVAALHLCPTPWHSHCVARSGLKPTCYLFFFPLLSPLYPSC